MSVVATAVGVNVYLVDTKRFLRKDLILSIILRLLLIAYLTVARAHSNSTVCHDSW